uniref:Uncharacterized protein n=1 Tax=Podarcis muralis TaxID=64176 RepID=A0A670I9W6_PODMU
VVPSRRGQEPCAYSWALNPHIPGNFQGYHPNVVRKGQVYLPIISTTGNLPPRCTQVIQALITLVNNPEQDHLLWAAFTKDHECFLTTAKELTHKWASGEKILVSPGF